MTLPGFRTDAAFADALDAADPLDSVQNKFVMPTDDAGKETFDLVGNALGVPARRSVSYVNVAILDGLPS